MDYISDGNTRHAITVKGIDKKDKFLEEAEETLQDYDDGFVFRKPACEDFLDKMISCREMDLFELYICVLLKELKNDVNLRNAVWDNAVWTSIVISGREVVYPYIKEIWDVIEKEYAEKTCSKMTTDSVFSRRVKRCGMEPQNKVVNSFMEADIIFYINKADNRESKYDDLIAFLLMYSRDLYDMMIENIENADLLAGIEETLKKMLRDYHNKETASDVARGAYDIMEKKQKKMQEKILHDEGAGYLSDSRAGKIMFWERVKVCDKWKDSDAI